MIVASEAKGQIAPERVAANDATSDADMAALLQVLQVTVRTHDAFRHDSDQASALAAWSESVALARAAIKATCAEKRESEQATSADTHVA